MDNNHADVLIHIDEEISNSELQGIEKDISTMDGVYSACTHINTPHLMVVEFDSDDVKAAQLLQRVTDRGLHAELVGL